jgi:hypothetical protein
LDLGEESIMSDSGMPFDATADETGAFPGPGDTIFPGVRAARSAPCSRSSGQDWYDYTTGYKEAADVLVVHVEQVGWRTDKLRYPILFLYGQHLELIVKNLIRECFRTLGRDQDFPRHHHLDRLWEMCAGLLQEIAPAASVDEVRETTRLFGELCAIDPASEAFRYPETTSGNAWLRGATEVNLSNVRDVVDKVSFFVDCIETSLHVERDGL